MVIKLLGFAKIFFFVTPAPVVSDFGRFWPFATKYTLKRSYEWALFNFIFSDLVLRIFK